MEPVALVGTRHSQLNAPRGSATVSYHFASEHERAALTCPLAAPANKRLSSPTPNPTDSDDGSDPFRMLGMRSRADSREVALGASGGRPTMHRVVMDGKIRMVADDGSLV
jgi:hypothetical protein